MDGGVGFGCGPNRYQPSAEEKEHPERLWRLGLTNRNTGLTGDEMWVNGPVDRTGDLRGWATQEIRLNLGHVLGATAVPLQGQSEEEARRSCVQNIATFLGHQS